MKERRTGAVVAVGGAVALLALAAVGIVAFAAGRGGEKTTTVTVAGAPAQGAAQTASVSPAVAAGAHDFVQFACAQCHGEQGRGGVSKFVPALTGAGKTLTPAELRKIIDHGLGVSADPARPYMPVWGEVVSTTQVNDLVAYIRAGLPAVADATPVPVPTGQGDAVAGAALYQRYGCVNCHGPNGLGGVPNPQSPDKAIPPLSGKTFRGEFDTAAKIADVIRTGSVIGRAPIVSMPHWGGILSDAQIRALVAYIRTLKP